MVKKRSVFDINFEVDDEPEDVGFPAGNPELETKSFNVQGHPLQNEAAPAQSTSRRGPMASAITEAADATTERATAEAAIRAENDALAHEHVRLKKLGLITDLIDTSAVVITKLTRDRSSNVDPELEELKDSIQAVGLSNPIRVEQTENGFELIQGFRRLAAFKELAEETGDPRYSKIPAALVPRGEPLVDLYRKMVDENLVRKDISFGEMAQLALSYARDEDMDPGDAVTVLYASALKQKRTYIRQFTRVLDGLGEGMRHPEAIPRSLGIELYKLFEADPSLAPLVADALAALPSHTPAAEIAVLRKALEPVKAERDAAPRSVAKTSLRLARPEGEARVIAQDGRVELRLPRDFSAVSRAKLQEAIEAFLTTLD
ncbi:ParB/RepB/Spo0J family partition protein [Litoreibacter janthinus]|uniref:Chromosome partitioning protein, ParB family n=1 Tax=Litoreibacter janthinus TaxID=670154 RepID=A0A1I6ICA3_9RHOB|nr:ParB N-terminal domain-containing protein [Litoreibacter janthinus]SFR64362.1 chromosome partitioning protein, ParB family [Litoreibacter janthinus]